MTITVTQFPLYPVAAREMRLALSCDAGGNYFKAFLTAAPRASKLHADLEKESSSQLLLHEGALTKDWHFTPDVGGHYEIDFQEIRKGANDFGGSFFGDPRGFNEEEILSTTTTTISAGTRTTMRVGSGQHTGTLVLYMFGSYCRATDELTHGETTPAIIDTTSERIESAARTANVVTALATLVGRTATTLMSSAPSTVFGNIAATFAVHRASAVYHDNADTDNTVDSSYYFPDNPSRLAESVGRLQQAFRRHQQNDDGSGVGTGSYHQSGGGAINATDYDHATTTDAPGDQESAVLALADLWWAYEAHRVDGIHKAVDGINTLTALGPQSIWQVHRYILTELAKTSQPAHVTENAGAISLASGFGMKAT